MGGGKGGQPKPQKQTGPDPMIAYLAQMQAAQAAQAEAVRKAQRDAMVETQRQSALASARQGELAAQQSLSQAGAMQKAQDIAASEAQQKAFGSAGTSAIGGGFDIGKSREEQSANLAGTGTIPASARIPFYGMGAANEGAGGTGQPANVFKMPSASNLTFGGS